MSSFLGVFAKHWTPGRAKTRLAAAVGDASAAGLHKLFLTTILGRFQDVADRRALFFSPPEERAEFTELGAKWTLEPQSDGDLGKRMADFFDRGFAGGAERVVLIGSDSPSLPAGHLTKAFEALSDRDVALGPSDDGGYYLVGARRQTPPIFEGVDWGGPDVWRQTLTLLERNGVAFESLPDWYDVDVLDDLIRLRDDPILDCEPQLRELRAAINAVLASTDNGTSP